MFQLAVTLQTILNEIGVEKAVNKENFMYAFIGLWLVFYSVTLALFLEYIRKIRAGVEAAIMIINTVIFFFLRKKLKILHG